MRKCLHSAIFKGKSIHCVYGFYGVFSQLQPNCNHKGKATLISVDSNGLRYLLAGRIWTRFGAEIHAAESCQSGARFVGGRYFDDSQLSIPSRQLSLFISKTRFHALRIFLNILPLLYLALMTLVMKDTQYNLPHVPHPF